MAAREPVFLRSLMSFPRYMNILLVYPLFPKSFWSFDKTVQLIGKKAFLPPLGLVTVAALLPQEWKMRLIDCNLQEMTDDDWGWADMILLSGMIAQKPDLLARIREAKRRGKPVAVGGPFATAFSDDCRQAGADFLVLDEGEITVPLWIDTLKQGATSGEFRSLGKHPDIATSPVPRFELLDLQAYAAMSVQFSRGCPFQCEFCDIIVLNGRIPRAKSPAQVLAELQKLYDLGWREMIFVVDDNFIGHKQKVKELLRALKPWMIDHLFPFSFNTESSLDLAADQELMDLMVACNFGSVFLGIETPDEESLALTKKYQNMRNSLLESAIKIQRSGLRIMSGFIIGFDNETPGAGQRIVRFVEDSAIPLAFFSMLQVLPDTALWHRLQREGRLLGTADINQTTLMNFTPTRPVQEIAREYIDGFWQLYEPQQFLDRIYRCYCLLGQAHYPKKKRAPKKVEWAEIKGLLTVFWRQGVQRSIRWSFWSYLWKMFRHNRGGLLSFISQCAYMEHFLEYRQLVKDELEAQLERLPAN